MDDVSLNGEQYTVSSIANNLLNSGQVTDEPPCTEMGLGTVKQVKSLIKMTTGIPADTRIRPPFSSAGASSGIFNDAEDAYMQLAPFLVTLG
ncbi:hypothetical protein PCANC_19553 [Puccinia coronata f. sp. avenae]|uniref:Uncharacterized protein n=1 Tax=Puccinia coronata f. sp. avenae TaxID=200324 RepID=A0A2N5U4W1_9BASI|nr:hypothetical protein PCANC_19553 [Puccinia coronata f. sp. avenae]